MALVEQWVSSWTTSENETSLITTHFWTNTCVHLVSSQWRLLPEADDELMICLNASRRFVLYSQTEADNQSVIRTFDTSKLFVFSLETYLGNISEQVSSVI